MCDICIPVLGRYARAHAGRPCSVANALYCGRCATNGHSPARCTKLAPTETIEKEARVVISLPPNAAKVFEVLDTDACVRSTLNVNGITPMVCQDVGKKKQKDFIENKRRLLELVKKKGRVLVLVTPGTVRAPKKPGAKEENGAVIYDEEGDCDA